jgi:hypothetical protein
MVGATGRTAFTPEVFGLSSLIASLTHDPTTHQENH